MMSFRELLGLAGIAVEAVGVITIVVGFVLSGSWFLARVRQGALEAYQRFRQDLARSILLGLEFLIAGDIIRTVTVEQTLTGAAVLFLIVLIRILLGVMLEVEIERRWPWQRARHQDGSSPGTG
jgi:uncharacterized membrane protein